MDFKTLLINRRSIREFQDKEVPLSIVKEIIQDTCLAPTASDLQPCRFIIIRDRDFMKKLSNESKKNLVADIIQNPHSPMKQYEDALCNEQFNVFYNASCLVYIIGPKDVALTDVNCALTASYFMFSAASRGLGTCWIELGKAIRDPKILEKIGMPDDYRIVAPLIIGYPTSIPAATKRHDPVIVKVL